MIGAVIEERSARDEALTRARLAREHMLDAEGDETSAGYWRRLMQRDVRQARAAHRALLRSLRRRRA